MADVFECCPGGAKVDLDEIRNGVIGSFMCLSCGRWFLSERSAKRLYNCLPSGPQQGDVIVGGAGMALRTRL